MSNSISEHRLLDFKVVHQCNVVGSERITVKVVVILPEHCHPLPSPLLKQANEDKASKIERNERVRVKSQACFADTRNVRQDGDHIGNLHSVESIFILVKKRIKPGMEYDG